MNLGHYLDTGKYVITLPSKGGVITVYCSDGDIYHSRDLPEGTNKVNVNILKPDYYTTDKYCTFQKCGEVVSEGEGIELPEAERFRLKDITVSYNPYLNGTPARIFTTRQPALIEVGPKFYTLPKQIRLFVLLHEYGHLFYATEWKVDRFAVKMFLQMGYNKSQALYAVSKVLNIENEENRDRINRMFNTLNN
jgi:hypothetical protein